MGLPIPTNLSTIAYIKSEAAKILSRSKFKTLERASMMVKMIKWKWDPSSVYTLCHLMSKANITSDLEYLHESNSLLSTDYISYVKCKNCLDSEGSYLYWQGSTSVCEKQKSFWTRLP